MYIYIGVLALVPAAIWLFFLFKKEKRRGIQLLIFFGSIFTVVPVLVLDYFLKSFPQFDVLQFLENKIQDQNIKIVLLFISIGIVEELVKQTLVMWTDKKYSLIHTIDDSIHFSLVAALGFAFTENIFYLSNIFTKLGLQELIIAFLFRSIFTTTAHLIFSGLFGYYYGISKFAINIVEQESWTGKHKYYPTFVAKLFGTTKVEAFKIIMILRGLWIAIVLHAIFNLLLQANQVIPVVLYVFVGFILLQYKLSQKTGKLILVTNAKDQTSSMDKVDEDVVVELLGMWFNSKKYVDVIHICQRLLERDPDNKVVQLFKAKAIDKIDVKSAYGQVLSKMFPDIGKSKNTIASMVKEKTLLRKKNQNPPPEPNPKITPPAGT